MHRKQDSAVRSGPDSGLTDPSPHHTQRIPSGIPSCPERCPITGHGLRYRGIRPECSLPALPVVIIHRLNVGKAIGWSAGRLDGINQGLVALICRCSSGVLLTVIILYFDKTDNIRRLDVVYDRLRQLIDFGGTYARIEIFDIIRRYAELFVFHVDRGYLLLKRVAGLQAIRL